MKFKITIVKGFRKKWLSFNSWRSKQSVEKILKYHIDTKCWFLINTLKELISQGENKALELS